VDADALSDDDVDDAAGVDVVELASDAVLPPPPLFPADE